MGRLLKPGRWETEDWQPRAIEAFCLICDEIPARLKVVVGEGG